MTAKKPNRKAQRHARRVERERLQVAADLRQKRAEVERALQIAKSMNIDEIVTRCKAYLAHLEELAHALEDAAYESWRQEHLDARA